MGHQKTRNWRAREELGTESWAMEKFLRKFDVIESISKDNRVIADLVFWGSYIKLGCFSEFRGGGLNMTRNC